MNICSSKAIWSVPFLLGLLRDSSFFESNIPAPDLKRRFICSQPLHDACSQGVAAVIISDLVDEISELKVK